MSLEKKLRHLHWLTHFARAVTTLGFIASAGGNVLHARHTPVAVIIALGAPIGLFLAFELVSRVPLRPESHWVSKYGRIAATGSIAAIMVIISYRSQKAAFMNATGEWLTATLLPGAIDALMIVGSITLIELGIQVRNLEAHMAGDKIKTTVVKPKPEEPTIIPPVKEPELSKKQRIAAIVAASPDLPYQEIADRAGASYNYVHSIVGKLRSADAELVSA
jgi:hypothetical protein